jgi:hypothetical protein
LYVAHRTDAPFLIGHARDVPRPVDVRAAADLFFAELMGQPLRQSPGRGRSAGPAWTEDTPVRSSVMNPGWRSWVVMVSNAPAKDRTLRWAGAIRQQSDASSNYTGWEDRSETFTVEKLSLGIKLDIRITAKVKGRLKGKDDAVYVTEATVRAFEPRDFSATRTKKAAVTVEVGFEDEKKKLRFVKASWDRDKVCARVDIPVRVSYSAKGFAPDDFTITWFGNGDPPITPSSP